VSESVADLRDRWPPLPPPLPSRRRPMPHAHSKAKRTPARITTPSRTVAVHQAPSAADTSACPAAPGGSQDSTDEALALCTPAKLPMRPCRLWVSRNSPSAITPVAKITRSRPRRELTSPPSTAGNLRFGYEQSAGDLNFTTLEFLDYLLSPGHTPGKPLALTCRSEEALTEAMVEWLERVQRDPSVNRLDLLTLSRAETAEQIELLLGACPRPGPAPGRDLW